MRRVEGDDGATQRRKAERRYAGECRDRIGPCPGGVDEHRRREVALRRAQPPSARLSFDHGDLSSRDDASIRCAQAASKAHHQRMIVEPRCSGVEQAAGDALFAQPEHRYQPAHRVKVDLPGAAGDGFHLGQIRLEKLVLAGAHDHQSRCRSSQRYVGKARWRVGEEGAAGLGQQAHRPVADAKVVVGGRAP